MTSIENDNLQKMAILLRDRNAIDADIASIIRRPAERGHIGEYIAGLVFDIHLQRSANHRGSDGVFKSGPLADNTVNIKTYGNRGSSLDIRPENLPVYYLVLTGPKTSATSSRGTSRPWVIHEIFLFEANPLVEELRNNNVKIGGASGKNPTSVKNCYWERARIYPVSSKSLLQLSESQQSWIRIFNGIVSPQ